MQSLSFTMVLGTSSSILKLCLSSDGHLFIHENDAILENIFLPFRTTSSASALKLCKKNDSLVFILNFHSEARMFQVKVVIVFQSTMLFVYFCNLACYHVLNVWKSLDLYED